MEEQSNKEEVIKEEPNDREDRRMKEMKLA